jgi:hypothetical protein
MKEAFSMTKGIFLATLVVVLHVALIGAIALLVFFFGGIVQHITWILIGGLILISTGSYWFYRRMKKQGKTLRETLSSPLFKGRPVEISLLGGVASIKVGRSALPESSEVDQPVIHQLEDEETQRIRELAEWGRMLEKDLVTRDEFERAKQRILKP